LLTAIYLILFDEMVIYTMAFILLSYHTFLARKGNNRASRILGLYDVMMTDILSSIIVGEKE